MAYGDADDWRSPLANWQTASNEDLTRFISAAWKWFAYYRDRAGGLNDYEWEHMVDQFDAIAAETSCGSCAGVIGMALYFELSKRRWEAAQHDGRNDQAGAGHSYAGTGPAA